LHERLSRGCTLLLIGLFKKVILADSLGGISDALFGRAAEGMALSFGES